MLIGEVIPKLEKCHNGLATYLALFGGAATATDFVRVIGTNWVQRLLDQCFLHDQETSVLNTHHASDDHPAKAKSMLSYVRSVSGLKSDVQSASNLKYLTYSASVS